MLSAAQFPRVQRFSDGSLTADVFASLSALSQQERVKKMMAKDGPELTSFAGDAVYHDGDLVLEGDFDCTTAGVAWLIVSGNLTVNGVFGCSDDPRSVVVVTGNFTAEHAVVSGSLEVQGDLHVSGALIGDYNHGKTWIGGNAAAGFFFTDCYAFEVAGQRHFTRQVTGNAEADREVLSLLVDEVFDAREWLALDSESREELADEKFDFAFLQAPLLRKRIHAGQSIFKS
jgi:hypothetical protein